MKMLLRTLQVENAFQTYLLLAEDVIRGEMLQEIFPENVNSKSHKYLDIQKPSAA